MRVRPGAGMLLFTICLLGVAVVRAGFSGACTPSACLSFPDSESWNVSDTYESAHAVWRGMLERGNDRLRVEIVSDADSSTAAYLTEVVTAKLATLYEPARSPYPGAVSRTIRCDATMMPKTDTGRTDMDTSFYYQAYANDRFVFGACSDAQASYAGFAVARYCGAQRQWVHIEYFTPVPHQDAESYRTFLDGIACRRRTFFLW